MFFSISVLMRNIPPLQHLRIQHQHLCLIMNKSRFSTMGFLKRRCVCFWIFSDIISDSRNVLLHFDVHQPSKFYRTWTLRYRELYFTVPLNRLQDHLAVYYMMLHDTYDHHSRYLWSLTDFFIYQQEIKLFIHSFIHSFIHYSI